MKLKKKKKTREISLYICSLELDKIMGLGSFLSVGEDVQQLEPLVLLVEVSLKLNKHALF